MAKRPHPPSPAPLAPPVETVNGWKIYAHPLFLEQIEELVREVEQLKEAEPDKFQEKKKTKLLAAIIKMAFTVIPTNPADKMFWQGNTLGSAYRHWLRGKFFEGRFRLFFRYSSATRVIVLAWVNDEETLRTYGSKTDAYAIFKGMLDKNRPPDDWDALMAEAHKATRAAREALKRGKEAR